MTARDDQPAPGIAMTTQPTPLDVLVDQGDGSGTATWMLVVGWAPGPDDEHPVLPVAVPAEGSAAPRVVYEPHGFRRPGA